MKSIRRFIVGLAILVGLIFNFNLNIIAAGDEEPSVGGGDGGVSAMPAVAISFNNDYATVPFPTVLLGRQAVTHYLLKQVAWVTMRFDGKSLATPGIQSTRQIYLPKNEGFTGSGSFSEISDIVAEKTIDLELVEIDGQFDLRVDIVLSDGNWKQCFVGSTWVQVEYVKGGGLGAYCEPWITLTRELNVDFGIPISGAKWLPGDLKYMGSLEELSLVYDFDGEDGPTAVLFPSDLIEVGYLAVVEAKTGRVSVLDLMMGKEADSETVRVIFGRLYSSDVTILRCPDGYTCVPNLNLVTSFYRYDGRVWGWYPLVEFVVGTPVSTMAQIAIPVWGTSETIKPVAVRIIQLGTEKSIELKVGPEGDFPIELEPGQYHVLVDFGDQVTISWAGGKG